MGVGDAIKSQEKRVHIPRDSATTSVVLLLENSERKSQVPPTPGSTLAVTGDTVQFLFRDGEVMRSLRTLRDSRGRLV